MDEMTKLGLLPELTEGLAKINITMPTKIQQQVIPAILKGVDIIGRSETGSGKTFAYLLPLFQKMDLTLKKTQVIILTPTHELAAQVQKQAEILAKVSGLPIKSVLIIGSASMTRQLQKLKEKPHMVVGSAGRILDFIQKRKISAHTVKTIVLDEGDRLLDDQNIESVQAVIKTTLKQRQIVLLSATVSQDIKKRAKQIMNENVVEISMTDSLLPKNIVHYYILAEKREKFIVLRKVLAAEKPKKAILFLNNPENIAVTVDKLCYHGLKADGIYGGAYKTERQNAMENFRQGRIHFLVASDIGARGLDIEDVTHIINLDLPEEPEQYLHRAGRTGRKGMSGQSISIVTPYERKWIRKYEKTWNITFVQKEMSFGKMVDSKKNKKEFERKPKKKSTTVGQKKIASKKEHFQPKDKR